MKIYIKNAERECIRELEEIRDNVFGYRAILVKLSICEVKNNSTVRQVVNDLTKTLEGNNARIFIFKDYDILVVYQGLSLKISEALIDILTDITGENSNKILRIYDLEKATDILGKICNKKIEMQHLEKQAKEQSAIEKATEAEIAKKPLNFNIDEGLIQNLNLRKNSNEKTKILLVEDDSFSRRMVKNIISKDYEIIEAENGTDALSKYVTQAPNVVFLDINLPDCTGMDVLERLISIDDKSYVVMLSGNSFKDNILLSIKKGAKGFIGKPFPKDKVEAYLEQYKRERINLK